MIYSSTSPSIMDPNVTVSKTNWAVTMTCDNKGFHARLLFEGIGKVDGVSQYFHQAAHLRGPKNLDSNEGNGCYLGMTASGFVDVSDRKDISKSHQVKYSHKTETWLISKQKIENLIDRIKQEVGLEVPFNILGNKSIFSKQAEIYEIYDPLVAEIKKQDANLFLRLYDSAQNKGECTGMNKNAFNKAIRQAFRNIRQYAEVEEYGYSDLVKIVGCATELLRKYQNSCLTWSLGQLETVGITLEDNALVNFISITTLYAKHKLGEPVTVDGADPKKNVCKKRSDQKVRKVYERFVCYDINRDKRTEDWKFCEETYAQYQLANSTASRVGAGQISATIAGVCVAPFALIPGLGIGAAALSGSLFTLAASGQQRRLDNNKISRQTESFLREMVISPSKFDCPGNQAGIGKLREMRILCGQEKRTPEEIAEIYWAEDEISRGQDSIS